MKCRIGDLVLGPILAVSLTAGALVILDRPPLGSHDSPQKTQKTRGWKAAGYLVPYLIIPAVQPLVRRRQQL